MGPFKGKVPVFARLWPGGVRVSVSFTTVAVRSAILATAGLLVILIKYFVIWLSQLFCTIILSFSFLFFWHLVCGNM